MVIVMKVTVVGEMKHARAAYFAGGYYRQPPEINAPVTDSSMAGTCEQLACLEEGQGCLGDSDCCLEVATGL